MHKVFLSYSKPINAQQTRVIKYIKSELEKHNIRIFEVQNETTNISPIYKINSIIKQCTFFLCIAYEKEKNIDKDGVFKHTTSMWLDIEIALAISNQIPFFVIKEDKISDTALLNSVDGIEYYVLSNINDFECLKHNIIPLLINKITG